MTLITHYLEVGLLIWFALLAAVVLIRTMRGDIPMQGLLQHSKGRGKPVAPERMLSMSVFPVVLISYAIAAMHTDASATHSLPELSNNLLMLLTGGNGLYLAGKIARSK
jgi:preprotein translocase subunit SecY